MSRKEKATAPDSKKALENRRPGKGRGPGKALSAKPKSSAQGFPIAGLGASAGGLEALEEFFRHMPPDAGIGFVVVTHQHPGHTSLLPELIGKCTRMPVVEAKEGQRVEPNRIYLSHPGDYLVVHRGAFKLVEFKEQSGLRLPIDYFFRSLAEDKRERAIGIVLSGTGTDGTTGLKAIKGAGGITMAQSPVSAKYSGMPTSAIDLGLVDYILRPQEMPQRLLGYVKSPYLLPPEPAVPADTSLPEAMQKILVLLRSRSGHDFSLYKTSTIRRRIERRLNVHQIKGPQQYIRYLQANPHELDLLFKELLIGVTNFFRDPEAYVSLMKNGLAELLKSKPPNATFRVWVPGCSTGEEAYSIAIVLVECMARLKKRFTVQIFGTDLDPEAIDTARAGLYPSGIVVDVTRQRLGRFFVKEDESYRICKEIREMVVFATQNAIKDPPFTKLDLVACRNLLIYLKADMQKRLLAMFHYALNPGGLLLLGPSESLGELSQHFSTADKKWKVFVRKQSTLAYPAIAEFPVDSTANALRVSESAPPDRPADLHASALFERQMLRKFVPACVITNERGDISYIHGRTGDYLEPAPGRPRLNLFEMAREGLRQELASAIRRASAQAGEVTQENVRVKTQDRTTFINIHVAQLTEPESLRGLFLVAFRSIPAPLVSKAKKTALRKTGRREQELERELQFTRESLQSTVEELETSNEELKSTNEELQSTNEELQSTNEELETSKEEMQSLNEELQTVNAQLQNKVEALSQANDDMQNLLNSTAIATIFLDRDLKIKRFTEQAKTIMNLIPTDVGRPIADLVSNLNYEDLVSDAAEVLRVLVFKEREVRTKSGDWRLVRILPYRTTENVIDGLVLTFIDINRIKMAEQAAQHARAFEEIFVETVREPMLVLDAELRVVSASKSFYRFFRTTPSEVEHRGLCEIANGQWDIPKLRLLLEEVLPREGAFEDFHVEHQFPGIGHRNLLLNARRLEQRPGHRGMILLAMEDVTNQERPGTA